MTHLIEYRNMEDEVIFQTNSYLIDPRPGLQITIDGKNYEVIDRFLKYGKRAFWWSLGLKFDSFYITVYVDEVD